MRVIPGVCGVFGSSSSPCTTRTPRRRQSGLSGTPAISAGLYPGLISRPPAGARVIATASESSAARVMALGADVVVDYHDPEWTSQARDAAGSSGIRAAVNAADGGEADALSTLADGGRLATITGAPPPEERGITITNLI